MQVYSLLRSCIVNIILELDKNKDYDNNLLIEPDDTDDKKQDEMSVVGTGAISGVSTPLGNNSYKKKSKKKKKSINTYIKSHKN